MTKHTLDHDGHQRSWVDVRYYRPYESSTPMIELEVRSGAPENDGLVMNTALKRLSHDQAVIVRDALNELIDRTAPDVPQTDAEWVARLNAPRPSGDELLAGLREGKRFSRRPTVHQLSAIAEAAEREATLGDELAGNPSSWPSTRRILAILLALGVKPGHGNGEPPLVEP